MHSPSPRVYRHSPSLQVYLHSPTLQVYRHSPSLQVYLHSPTVQVYSHSPSHQVYLRSLTFQLHRHRPSSQLHPPRPSCQQNRLRLRPDKLLCHPARGCNHCLYQVREHLRKFKALNSPAPLHQWPLPLRLQQFRMWIHQMYQVDCSLCFRRGPCICSFSMMLCRCYLLRADSFPVCIGLLLP